MLSALTSSGPVVGRVSEGVAAFSGIRYGCLADGRRFDPVAPVGEDSKQDLRERPAVFPQLPSRLSAVTGPAIDAHPQEEDAFLLNIWAPQGASGKPVLMIVHGGAFVAGGSSVRWHDGRVLARDGDMIVVGVNYRLGPLAHLSLGEHDNVNRALGDLTEALNWVRRNISSFGGDPEQITLSGQSAGGFLVRVMAVMVSQRDKFRRLLVMSSPGIPALTRQEAGRLSGQVIAGLQGADPRTVPVVQLLESHRKTMVGNRTFGKVGMGLMPVIGDVVPDWLTDADRMAQELRVTDLMVTFTRDETAAFFFTGPERHVTREQLRELYGNKAAQGGDPYWELIARTSAARFADPARSLATAAASRGINALVREFVTPSPLEGLRCGHCVDIPYFFGNLGEWHDAPMTYGLDRERFENESRQLRDTVADFVHGRKRRSA